jgi:hypothetical protein
MRAGWMIAFVSLSMLLAGVARAGGHDQSLFEQEPFTEDDFAQFFSLIEDGKIAASHISERCQKQGIGFTFVGTAIEHAKERQRIYYNVSKEDSSADGRTLRAKHFNASFGEWTGSVFKPLCPGMYLITVEFVVVGRSEVALYLRRAGEERPGKRVVASSEGHLTLALPLRSLDEISTWSEADNKRRLKQVTLTGIKVQHLEDYVTDVDMDLFSEEIVFLKSSAQD